MTGTSASRQTTAPLSALRLSASKREARHLSRTALDGDLALNPPYQRGAVWTADQQIALVFSWLRGLPIPAVVLNDRGTSTWREASGDPGEETWACIDGQQRIRTAVDWFAGDLAVPASWFPATDVVPEAIVDTADGPYITYTGLTATAQRSVARSFHLPVVEAQLATVAQEADLYLLLNGGGTPHTEADLAVAAAHATPQADQTAPATDQVTTYTDTLPAGYRWATEDEVENHTALPVLAYVARDGGQADLAVPAYRVGPLGPTPLQCTCGATDLQSCVCGTTPAQWAAAERTAWQPTSGDTRTETTQES